MLALMFLISFFRQHLMKQMLPTMHCPAQLFRRPCRERRGRVMRDGYERPSKEREAGSRVPHVPSKRSANAGGGCRGALSCKSNPAWRSRASAIARWMPTPTRAHHLLDQACRGQCCRRCGACCALRAAISLTMLTASSDQRP